MIDVGLNEERKRNYFIVKKRGDVYMCVSKGGPGWKLGGDSPIERSDH